MKKIIMVTLMSMAVLSITVFPCFAADETYYGCYQKNNGQLRIVGSPNECRSSEVFISWNEVGPAGPMGPIGPAGGQGLQGPVGATGVTGAQGPIGPAGAIGPAGPAGATGAAGPIGSVGAAGVAGPTGPAGPQGAVGPAGNDGVSGRVIVSQTSALNSNTFRYVGASCPGDTRVVGGGAAIGNEGGSIFMSAAIAITTSMPYEGISDSGWYASAIEMSPVEDAWQLTVTVICAIAN